MTPFTNIRYAHGDVLLNVSGERDEDECQITRITAADSQIDLFDIFQPRTIRDMADSIDAKLSREARQESAIARAERSIAERESWGYSMA